MNKLIFLCSILVLFILTTLYSCTCSCSCEKNLGCKILIAQHTNSGDTIEIKIFCSQGNFATDTILQDSVTRFNNRYQTAGIIVKSRDSIYKFDRRDNLNCNQAKSYSQNNYWCTCAK